MQTEFYETSSLKIVFDLQKVGWKIQTAGYNDTRTLFGSLQQGLSYSITDRPLGISK